MFFPLINVERTIKLSFRSHIPCNFFNTFYITFLRKIIYLNISFSHTKLFRAYRLKCKQNSVKRMGERNIRPPYIALSTSLCCDCIYVYFSYSATREYFNSYSNGVTRYIQILTFCLGKYVRDIYTY